MDSAPSSRGPRLARSRGLSGPGAGAAAGERGDLILSPARDVADDRRVSHRDPGFHDASLQRQARDSESAAGRSWNSDAAGGLVHAEESHLEPDRGAIHEVRPHYGESTGLTARQIKLELLSTRFAAGISARLCSVSGPDHTMTFPCLSSI